MIFHRIVLAGLLAAWAGGAWAEETAGDATPAVEAESAMDRAQNLLSYALGLVGVQYKYGGKSPESGLDCSGFVRHVFQQAAGLMLPHNARAISMFGRKIAISELQPGDLVFYNTMRHAYSHVGIYLGNDRFIHASVTGRGVEIVNMKEGYWVKRFNGARRLFAAPLPSPF
jgi:cell wall-associated NlpC family hydrolase